jgi:formate dehydrogenase major subunit
LSDVPDPSGDDLHELLKNNKLKNIFVFGEDPVGCAIDKNKVSEWISNAEFMMVQDYFMTETAAMADLILPSSLPSEAGGSYTNTLKVIQKFEKITDFQPPIEDDSIKQLISLNQKFGTEILNDSEDVMMEAIGLLHVEAEEKYGFVSDINHQSGLFKHGCDHLVKLFDDESFEKLKK